MSAIENRKPGLPETPSPGANGLFGVMLQMAGVVETIAYYAQHDDLTGLLTKEAVKQRGEELIEADKAFAVFLMDWDAFKVINDTLGHERADQMLADFGPYMQSHFRREGEVFAHEKSIREPETDHESEYTLGRYGGDEFLGLVNLSDRGAAPDGLTHAERLEKTDEYVRSVIAGFVDQQEQDVRDLQYNISVGASLRKPGSRATFSEVVHEADQLMFEDKKTHKAPVR